ncbi:MAG: alpha/beta hydrolase [Chloroflexi bacterium]|nr:alpha/beta hydrolase [Anaerolineaceae bacterium]NMB88103.1 alpha/beta hydrolase [Chloroflexota bacterium]
MSMYVYESGASGASAILWLHGGGVGSWAWQEQLRHFSDYHQLAPDLPEQGRSLAEKPFTIRDAAERAAALIRNRGRDGRACVVGHSLGAQVLVQLLAIAPEVVERAVICSALVHPLPGKGLIRPMLRAYMPFKDLPWLVRANFNYLGLPAAYYDHFAQETRRASLDSMAHIFTENMSFGLPPGLESAQAPALVLAGEKEYGMLKRSLRQLAAALPNGRGCLGKGMIHNWPVASPDTFNQVVRAWLEERPLPGILIGCRP